MEADGDAPHYGRLWVTRSTPNGTRELDVIEKTGRVAGTIPLGKLNVSNYGPFTVRGDNIYVVVLDDDDVPFVVRLHITK